jgi:hypothetical protein
MFKKGWRLLNAWGEGFRQKARGVQENLWPKFILKNAPLRATSSAGDSASAMPWAKVVKLKKPGGKCPVVIAGWLESFTFAGGWKTVDRAAAQSNVVISPSHLASARLRCVCGISRKLQSSPLRDIASYVLTLPFRL